MRNFKKNVSSRMLQTLGTGLPTLGLAIGATSCTGQIPNSFRLAQQDEKFATSQGVNTKVDMLFVVDNSASMDVIQKNLRNGFAAFAQKYMKPTWDIRLATITTDAYLAHPAFGSYLNSTYLGSGYQSTYYGNSMSSPPGGSEAPVNPFRGSFGDPAYASWMPGTINSSGKTTRAITVGQAFPSWGSSWSQLLPGTHDGPMTALCFELNSYFFFGESQCFIRDNGGNRGPDHCLNPQGSEDSTTQCVNTFQNDTIHSQQPIISTQPPAGTAGDAAWVSSLVRNFTINLSTGSSGSGSERGFSSVLQMMRDNEDPATRKSTANPLFRPNSLRVIVFVSDEDDQTISLDANDTLDPAPFAPTTPFSGYITSASNCPVTPGAGQTANCCAAKTVDGYTYIIPVCPKGYPAAANSTPSAVLMPVAHVKQRFDSFFQKLDGLASAPATPSYFVASIVLTNGASVQNVRKNKRCTEEGVIFGGTCDDARTVSSDRGDRYIDLANQVGNGSISMDLSATDYTPILNAIGDSIVLKKSSFTLSRAPTGSEEMVVRIIHADGSVTMVQSSQYSISDTTLTLTDQNLVLSLSASDSVSINYQPKSVN